MCGTWLHNGSSQTLDIDLNPGCKGISISASASTLSIRGSITAKCNRSELLALEASQGSSSSFCVYWEPLLDQLMLELNGKNSSLCNPSELQTWCCTHLSPGHQSHSQLYGVKNGNLHGDPLSDNVMAEYGFKGEKINCKEYFCDKAAQESRGANISHRVLEDVVGITVENEIITNLPEPVRIKFYHPALMETQKRKCVSWDTRKDNEVEWRETGCITLQLSAVETECCCNHLTYFAILVDMNPTRSVRHLEALTIITAVCCAVSIASCAILFISLCRQRKSKNHSSLVHRGLVVALFFLLVLFVLTGTVANTASESVCRFIGGLLHYTLLSVLCWMAVEVIHTFWMMYMVFSAKPKPWIWCLLGFGVPALPVIILGSIGDIYGQRAVKSSDVLTTPYRMCWMTDSRSALMAHFIINTGLLVAVVSSGLVMLFLVFRKIRHRDEWRTNRVAFLSIWGLSCLFGSTWALAFFSSEASETVLFLFCIINSLQGFFLMLRFFALERMQKNSQSSSDFSSTGSTRQHMLQPQEKN
ncbi:hypothetical protein PDJAM_G00022230 [Pangasius djambal]|uniref:Uncharacterized protein n=1 Tax=Pangasius djambal TaxID=1691987 RepID=A0ACC5YN97_9TELE|nr:hypothetical protein [Pangasius djambal]